MLNKSLLLIFCLLMAYTRNHCTAAPPSILSKSLIPASYTAVEKLMAASILQALTGVSSSEQAHKKFFIEVRTPGLNDKIEQTAIVSKDLLFDLVADGALPPLARLFPTVKVMFPSSGDAAGFQAHLRRRGRTVPSGVDLTDVAEDRVVAADSCLLIVGARNNVGDPVLRTIKRITEAAPSTVCLLLNCDLTDRVTTGMTDRTIRDAYRSSFLPIFYFRNLVSIMRPSQIPIERGALLYTPSSGWRVFAVDDSRILGPGSLNRFMKTPAFQRHPDDASAADPPPFLLAGVFGDMPKRDAVDECLSAAAYRVEKLVERRLRGVDVGSVRDAVDRLRRCARDRECAAPLIESAIDFLLATPRYESSETGGESSSPQGLFLTDGLMKPVDIRDSERVDKEDNESVLPVTEERKDFSWGVKDSLLFEGRWGRCFSGGTSSLGDQLFVTASDVRIEKRVAPLTIINGTLSIIIPAPSAFGFSFGEDNLLNLDLVYIDNDMVVLRETPVGTLTLWRRMTR